MVSTSNSSFRTLSEDTRERDDSCSLLAPLTGVPLPNCVFRGVGSLRDGLELMDSGRVDPLIFKGVVGADSSSSTPLFPKSHLSKGTLRLFESNTSFNCPGGYVGSTLDIDKLSEYCSFGDGYSVSPPLGTDRMWMCLKPGRHAIPDLWFEYGLRLPMHPFFMIVLDTFKCGIGQLAPNAVL